MAHELYQHDQMISGNNITPWHRLGKVAAGALTLEDAFQGAEMGWHVIKQPAFTRMERTDTFEEMLATILPVHAEHPDLTFAQLLEAVKFDLPIEDKFATIREDIAYPLGVVGKDYTPFQNYQGKQLMEALLSGGDVEIETAGTLRNGRQVWILAKLDKDLTIGGDQHTPYILFVWSHDGTTALRIVPTPVRVVCANTMRMALSSAKSSWTTSHTKGIKVRAAEIAETLKLTWAYYDEFEAEVQRLIDTTVTELRFEQILEGIVPDPTPNKDGKVTERRLNNAIEKRGAIRKLYNLDDRVGEFRGTGWGVVQAFNIHDLWEGRIHGGEGMRAERQAARVLTGDTMANTSKVRELVLATDGA